MIEIDLAAGTVHLTGPDGDGRHGLGTPEAFAAISRAWVRCGWDVKYVYGFTWFGRPVIQLPEDLIRLQEVVYQVKPDVIIETGVAHGGGQVFLASLCKALGRGRVIGIEVELRPHNRAALNAHELRPLITLFDGSSIDPVVIERVRASIAPGENTLVLLDSNHTRDHVLAELEAYAPFVGVGSYLIAADGIMQEVVGAPRTKPDWGSNNPRQAVAAFLTGHPEFEAVGPPQPFNEGLTVAPVTYWPDGYLRRRR